MSQTGIVLSQGEGASRIMGWRGGSQSPQPAQPAPKILELGRGLLRHGKLLFVTILLLNLLAAYGVSHLARKYTASADVLVEPREEQVVDLKAVLSGLSGTTDVIESEIQVVQSRVIARAVVQQLHLDQMAEFNPALRGPGLKARIQQSVLGRLRDFEQAAWSALHGTISPVTAMLGLSPLPAAAPQILPPGMSAPVNGEAGDVEPTDPLSVPVDRFLSQLSVASKGRSRVMTITFTSTDPAIAAKVPNAVAEAYIANQLRLKTDATAQAHKWLDERVAEQRVQLLAEDEAVEAYRKRAGIVPIHDSTLLNQQISEVGQELMKAQEQVAEVEGRKASLVRVNPTALGLDRELEAAKAREQRVAANLDVVRQKLDEGSHSEIGLRALQREADVDRSLYDRLLARARETKIQSGLQQADATIISRAERPEDPSFPKPIIIMPLYFVASCIIGVLLVIWLETLDRGFLTLAQLESTLGIPAIGAIPYVRRGLRGRGKVDDYALSRPKSPFADAIRNLHSSLVLSGNDGGTPKTILIASALPGEGKSSVALSIGSLMASCGRRVVVIDCDLRKPTIHQRFDTPNKPGLTDCLDGSVALEDALRRDPQSSLYFLPAGSDELVPPDVFSSSSMRTLLDILSTSFELILLDAGPLMGTSDARHLCRLADRTVMVVRWQDTRCAVALHGLRQLVDAGATFAGAILTMVDLKQYEKYSPTRHYRRRLANYYAGS